MEVLSWRYQITHASKGKSDSWFGIFSALMVSSYHGLFVFLFLISLRLVYLPPWHWKGCNYTKEYRTFFRGYYFGTPDTSGWMGYFDNATLCNWLGIIIIEYVRVYNFKVELETHLRKLAIKFESVRAKKPLSLSLYLCCYHHHAWIYHDPFSYSLVDLCSKSRRRILTRQSYCSLLFSLAESLQSWRRHLWNLFLER